jgi:hypothetical protein
MSGLQARATWRMKNINFYIETASVQSSFLEQAIASKLAAGEPINVPFENIFSFTQSNEGASFNQRMSVSSQSVNKILAITQLESDLSGVGKDNSDANQPQQKIINGVPQALRRNYNQAGQAQFSVNNQYSPNYQIDSQLTTSVDLVGGNSIIGGIPNDSTGPTGGKSNLGYFNNQPGVYQVRNRTFSNALVETRAAMDIPDYDYDQADMLTNPTQMPFEYFGAPKNRMQPGSNGLMLSPVVSAQNVGAITFDTPQLVRVENVGNSNLTAEQWNAIGAPGELTAIGQIFEMTNISTVTDSTVTVKPISPPAPKRESQYWFPYSYQDGLSHYLNDKYVLATSFDLDTCDKDRLVSGINTLGSNAQMFLNVVAAPNASNNTTDGNLKNKSTVFVMCTSMVQIYQGATLHIIQ